MEGWDVLFFGEHITFGEMQVDKISVRGKICRGNKKGVCVQVKVVGVVDDAPIATVEFKGRRKTHTSGCGQLQDGVNTRVEINKRFVI